MFKVVYFPRLCCNLQNFCLISSFLWGSFISFFLFFLSYWNLGFQGGGFSPGKLRSMLLGVEKKRKEDEELDSTFTSRSQNSDMDESGMYVLSFDFF